MTLSERIKLSSLTCRESCPNLELLRKRLGYSYGRGALSEPEMQERASDSARAGTEAFWEAK